MKPREPMTQEKSSVTAPQNKAVLDPSGRGAQQPSLAWSRAELGAQAGNRRQFT